MHMLSIRLLNIKQIQFREYLLLYYPLDKTELNKQDSFDEK